MRDQYRKLVMDYALTPMVKKIFGNSQKKITATTDFLRPKLNFHSLTSCRLDLCLQNGFPLIDSNAGAGHKLPIVNTCTSLDKEVMMFLS